MLLAFVFFGLLLAAGLAWEAWSFYNAPIIEDQFESNEEEKHDAA